MASKSRMGNRIAFNINVYKKFSELEILIELLRQEYSSDIFINLTCNDLERSAGDFAHLDIDNFEQGTRFRVDRIDENAMETFIDPERAPLQSVERRFIALRRIEQLTKGLNLCAEMSDATYTVNLHADSWPLSQEGLSKVIDSLEASGRPFASRGYGYAYTSPERYPHGAIHDIFFVAENEVVRESQVFDFKPSNLALAIPNTHGTIMSMIQLRYGADGIHWYSDLTDTVGWDGEPKLIAPNAAMRPLTYEPSFGLLHFNKHFFPEDFGERFMSKFLVDHGFISGSAIEDQLARHPADEGLVSEYEEYLRSHPLIGMFHRTKRHNMNVGRVAREYEEASPIGRIKMRGKEKVVKILEGRPKIGSTICPIVERICNLYDSELINRYQENVAFFAAIQQQLGSDGPLPGVIEYEVEEANVDWTRTFVGSNLAKGGVPTSNERVDDTERT